MMYPAKLLGAPTWVVHTSANSGARFFISSPMARTNFERSCGVMRGHGPLSNASRAARIARSTSFRTLPAP